MLLRPKVFTDERGFFFEPYNMKMISKLLGIEHFVQENQAYSYKGVLRGLHFQVPPKAQGKLVRCLYGEILDVAVDLRPMSATFGKHYKVSLSHNNNSQLWIPPGFAHGALTVSDFSVMAYYCTELYSPENAHSIAYDDPHLAIDWEMEEIMVNARDRNAPAFIDYNYTEIWNK